MGDTTDNATGPAHCTTQWTTQQTTTPPPKLLEISTLEDPLGDTMDGTMDDAMDGTTGPPELLEVEGAAAVSVEDVEGSPHLVDVCTCNAATPKINESLAKSMWEPWERGGWTNRSID